MGLGSSLDRARIHRSIQTVVVTLSGSSAATDAQTDVTLATPVTSTRYVVTRQTPYFSNALRVKSYTLTSTTNLRIIWSRDATVASIEQWVVEEFF